LEEIPFFNIFQHRRRSPLPVA